MQRSNAPSTSTPRRDRGARPGGPRSLGGWLLALALTAACGARSGLRVPHAADDAALDAPFDIAAEEVSVPPPPPPDVVDERPSPPDVCVPNTVTLVAGRAEVMFVLDRSESMSWTLTTSTEGTPSRWSILRGALDSALPRYEAAMEMGLLLYPVNDTDGVCQARNTPDLTPQPMSAAAIRSIMRSARPAGFTPTAAALASAQRHFVERPSPGRVRAVVLATDGAPNCNAALDGNTCPCTSDSALMTGDARCVSNADLCLDDVRAIRAVEAMARAGVPTYVIGIDGIPSPGLTRVLSQLAAAGGRPNPLDMARGYYSVRRAEDLSAAFDRIERAITQCAFSLPAPVSPGQEVSVALDGAEVRYDPARGDGWDWGDPTRQSVVLSGSTCMRAQGGVHTLTLTARCP